MAIASAARGRTRRRGRGARAPMSEINVTPFVDVMLVLLIIFMVTAPLLTAGVPIELPESRAKALSEEKLQVTISIASDGTVFVEERPVPLVGLAATLASLPRTSDGKPPLITLRGDKKLDYGTVMGVMGELNRAGFNSISLVTNASVEAPGQERQESVLSDGSGEEQ